uniref:Uncharacterized protein n=1 Tax=Romanomermis culicivorax TaxID=13658 RepID=A0A915I365_ROMCU
MVSNSKPVDLTRACQITLRGMEKISSKIDSTNLNEFQEEDQEMSGPPNRWQMIQFLVTDTHMTYGQPQLLQDNGYFLIDDYNVKCIIKVGKLE